MRDPDKQRTTRLSPKPAMVRAIWPRNDFGKNFSESQNRSVHSQAAPADCTTLAPKWSGITLAIRQLCTIQFFRLHKRYKRAAAQLKGGVCQCQEPGHVAGKRIIRPKSPCISAKNPKQHLDSLNPGLQRLELLDHWVKHADSAREAAQPG